MKQVHSAGIVLFREDERGRQYLLLFTETGTGFPKGRPEGIETEEETARRETQEETGIKAIELIPGFLERTDYWLFDRGRRTKKTVTFFLGRTKESRVVISWEHKGFKWCTVEEAIKTLRYKNQKDLIRKAESLLQRA